MSRHRERPELRPEEEHVAQILTRILDDVSVEQHDDGSEDGQYDLDVTGSISAAVEVGVVTDADIRRANAHWRDTLEAHQTVDLKWSWIFTFLEASALGAKDRFPRVTRPATKELTAVLERLEARGIMRVGRAWDYAVVELGGWRIGDQDIAELFRLLGAVAEGATAVDLSHHGEPGGWSFAFGFGHVSSTDLDQFAAHVEAILHDDRLADMREKLERSRKPVRIAALVFDSTTSAGWSTGHVNPGTAPEAPIELPAEITQVLVVGLNDVTLTFSEPDGWANHDAADLVKAPAEQPANS